ncbi:hypothetical protein SynRS9902_00612 [Synechococcus sp. RS9902]|nr:hypothetical protein SynRS9902_00612 [Synechococcus sp. RS9902]
MIHNRLRSSPLPTGLDRPVARQGFLSMKWMLLLVFVVVGVGTLMGTITPPVL